VTSARLSDAGRLDWLRLARTSGVGPVTFHQLITRFGTADAAIDELPRLAKRGGRAGRLDIVTAIRPALNWTGSMSWAPG